MPYKPPRKKSNKKKPGRKKMSFAQVTMIALAVVMASAFLIFSVYSPRNKRNPNNRTLSGEVSVPKFRKDGQIRVLTNAGPVTVDVEIADNESERTQGLMYRYSMEERNGMFFIFPEEAPRSFWMKNTFIPLDIIYINANKEIVSIQKDTQPKSTYSLPSERPAQYVLEVNAGFTDKYNVAPGNKIEIQK